MPPRYAYWTIIAGGLPTAFRAAQRDELLPTFQRLREKHPDAEMKWFARGRLWESPEAARPGRGHDGERFRKDAGAGPRPDRRQPGRAERRNEGDRQDARGRDWRPGGSHRDPRQPYVDAKKARNLERRKRRFDSKHGPGAPGSGRARQDVREGRGGQDNRAHGKPRDSRHSNRQVPSPTTPPPARRANTGTRGQGGQSHGPRAPRPQGSRWDGTRPERPRPPFRSRDERPRFDNRDRRGPSDQRRPDKRDWPPSKPAGGGAKPHAGGRPPGGSAKRGWNRPSGSSRPRPLDRGGFPRGHQSDTNEPPQPKRPRGPNREPRPSENPEPTPPPRPSEPAIAPPGPPERGRRHDPDAS